MPPLQAKAARVRAALVVKGTSKKLLFLRYALSVKGSFTLVNSAFTSMASLEKSNF
jgi:hypothetical protein